MASARAGRALRISRAFSGLLFLVLRFTTFTILMVVASDSRRPAAWSHPASTAPDRVPRNACVVWLARARFCPTITTRLSIAALDVLVQRLQLVDPRFHVQLYEGQPRLWAPPERREVLRQGIQPETYPCQYHLHRRDRRLALLPCFGLWPSAPFSFPSRFDACIQKRLLWPRSRRAGAVVSSHRTGSAALTGNRCART